MKNYVVDASVAAKWFLPPADEPFQPQAEALLNAFGRGELRLMVPDLFWAEVANVMCKSVRRSRISASEAAAAIVAAKELRIQSVSCQELIGKALEIALKHNRSLYDCLYIALASEVSIDLITADERLANAVAAHLPVKWLGAL